MTPFQALLADKDAIAEYIELCRKLPQQEDFRSGDFLWWDGKHRFGEQIFQADLHTKNPANPGVYVVQRTHGDENNWWCYVTQGDWFDGELSQYSIRRLGDFKPNIVYLPSDLAEWMAMDGWPKASHGDLKHLWFLSSGDDLPWRVNEFDNEGNFVICVEEDYHPHLAAARAVMGVKA